MKMYDKVYKKKISPLTHQGFFSESFLASEASVLGWGLRPDTLRYVALAILFVTGVSDSTFLSKGNSDSEAPK